MYKLIYEKRVFKDLDNIPKKDVERIVIILDKLSHNPATQGGIKLSGKTGIFRIRKGNYRIIYSISHKSKEIRIILIKHRKESYRKL